MKTQNESKTFCKAYLDVSKDARKLQRDLLELVDEMILAPHRSANGGEFLGEVILAELERFEEDSYYRLNPVCVGLLKTIKEVIKLQANAYDLRYLVHSD